MASDTSKGKRFSTPGGGYITVFEDGTTQFTNHYGTVGERKERGRHSYSGATYDPKTGTVIGGTEIANDDKTYQQLVDNQASGTGSTGVDRAREHQDVGKANLGKGTTQVNTDGSKTTTYPDGTQYTVYANGSTATTKPDGKTWVRGSKGGGKSPTSNSDGTFTAPDGSPGQHGNPTNPTGTNPTGTNPTGTNPTGTSPTTTSATTPHGTTTLGDPQDLYPSRQGYNTNPYNDPGAPEPVTQFGETYEANPYGEQIEARPFGESYEADPFTEQFHYTPFDERYEARSFDETYEANPWDREFEAPSFEEFRNSPGFQFMLQEALTAQERQASAMGNLSTTGTLKDLQNRAAGLASTGYGDHYERSLAGFRTNRDSHFANEADRLSAYDRRFGAHQDNEANRAGAYDRRYGAHMGNQDRLAGAYESRRDTHYGNEASRANAYTMRRDTHYGDEANRFGAYDRRFGAHQDNENRRASAYDRRYGRHTDYENTRYNQQRMNRLDDLGAWESTEDRNRKNYEYDQEYDWRRGRARAGDTLALASLGRPG